MTDQDERPVLVAYASKHGSTAEIAERIAATLRSAGCPAETRPTGGVDEISLYRAVVLGSAVYMTLWRRDARSLARRQRRALRSMPVWLFSSGPIGAVEEHPTAPTPRGIPKLVRELGAREHVMFGGRLPSEPANFIEKAMVRKTPPDRLDARDWEQIERWARSIAAGLGCEPSERPRR